MPTDNGIGHYLGLFGNGADKPLAERPRTQHTKRAPVFTGLSIVGSGGSANLVPCGGGVTFEVEMQDFNDPGELTCAIALYNEKNQRVALFHTQYQSGMTFRGGSRQTLVCTVPSLPLTPGTYHVELVYADGYHILEQVDRAGKLEVIFNDYLGTGKLPNYQQCQVVLPCTWQQ
jgi:hypothetical protein